MGPMKPGTPVTNIEPLTDGPHVIPPGTLGIVEWCDRARGEACVQFIGHILQRGVDVAALRECTPLARLAELETALAEVNRRICEDSRPLVDFLNAHKGESGHKEAAEAYKWAVYGTAIHAQIALRVMGE